MCHDPTTGPPDPELADKLFNLVQSDQGYAFISDGVDVFSRPELLKVARMSLYHSRRVVRHLETFLKEESRDGDNETF